MPNTQNFKSNIAELSSTYTKYTVSRIIANKSDDLLNMEMPAEFAEELLENNIEVNLYSVADNSLIFAGVIKNTPENTGAIYTENLQYSDGTSRKLLYINFAKLNEFLQLPSGQYSVTLNFFTNELGDYDNRILKVNRISTSRTEVELKLTDSSQQQKLEQFAIPRIPVEYIKSTLRQIFNQEGADQIVLPMSSVKIDSSSLYQNFTSGSGQQLLQYNFDDDDQNGNPGVNTITQNVLNIAYPIALKTIEDMIFLSGSTNFTETQLSQYVIDAIDIAYDAILQDEEKYPSKYRFDLI